MSLDPALRARIENLLQANRAVLFMKGEPSAPQCGFSAKAAGALALLDIEYAHVNVLADPEIREGIKAYGNWPTIPQLYVGGELVGGADIIAQMVNTGELQALLGLPAPDRTPPKVIVSAAAVPVLREAVANAGTDYAVQIEIDARFNARMQLAPFDPSAIVVEQDGIRMQFDMASARRGEGMSIDFADDDRGRGLIVDLPQAPAKVKRMTPGEAKARVGAGTLTLVDVRTPEERAVVKADVPFSVLDGGAAAELEALPKDTPLAFLCQSGARSAQVAEHFRNLGFREVYNVEGGIELWPL